MNGKHHRPDVVLLDGSGKSYTLGKEPTEQASKWTWAPLISCKLGSLQSRMVCVCCVCMYLCVCVHVCCVYVCMSVYVCVPFIFSKLFILIESFDYRHTTKIFLKENGHRNKTFLNYLLEPKIIN